MDIPSPSQYSLGKGCCHDKEGDTFDPKLPSAKMLPHLHSRDQGLCHPIPWKVILSVTKIVYNILFMIAFNYVHINGFLFYAWYHFVTIDIIYSYLDKFCKVKKLLNQHNCNSIFHNTYMHITSLVRNTIYLPCSFLYVLFLNL